MGDSVQVMVAGEQQQPEEEAVVAVGDHFCDVLLGKNMDKTASSPDSAIGNPSALWIVNKSKNYMKSF